MTMSIDCGKVLPSSLVINSLDTTLYRIGLSFESEVDIKRKRFCNPRLIFVIVILFLIQNLFNLFVRDDPFLSILFGNYGYFLKIGKIWNVVFIFAVLLVVGSQFTYYYNHKNDTKPTFLRVFQMMSGSVTPRAVGLTNSEKILKLLKKTRISFKILSLNNNYFLPFLSFALIITLYLLNCTLAETLIYGLPNAVLYTAFAYHAFNIAFYQCLYFYILCCYLKIKIENIKINLLISIEKKKNSNLHYMCQRLVDLCSECSEYNTSFWSKNLLLFWFSVNSADVCFLFMALFLPMKLFFKLVIIYCFVSVFFMLSFIISIASSVNCQFNEFHPILNSVYTMFSKQYSNRSHTRVRLLIKVKL